MLTFPVKLYVDILAIDKASAVCTDKKLTIYAINKINELRNSKLEYPIKIEDQSPVQQFGRYVCLIIATEDFKGIRITFHDPKIGYFPIKEISESISENDSYILSEIVKYINENYESLYSEVELIKGMPDFLYQSTIIPAT